MGNSVDNRHKLWTVGGRPQNVSHPDIVDAGCDRFPQAAAPTTWDLHRALPHPLLNRLR